MTRVSGLNDLSIFLRYQLLDQSGEVYCYMRMYKHFFAFVSKLYLIIAEYDTNRAVARTLIGGGGGVIHIFMFCPTSFFSD